jgi:predicted metal-dependent peptidase
MKVEVMRILLKHPYSRRKEQASVAYLASNITIKEYIETTLPLPKAKDVFGTNTLDRKHFELYYDKLLQQADIQNSSDNTKHPKSKKSKGKSSNSEESNYDEPKNEESNSTSDVPKAGADTYSDANAVGNENADQWDTNDWMAGLIDEKIEAAIQNQSWGSIKGKLQEVIVAAFHPKMDYRRVLSAFRQSVLSSNRTLTRMKPSRRYDFQYMGSRRDFCTKMLFAMDVSGSVSSEDLNNALGTLNRFFRYGVAAIDVVQFDTEIKGEPLTLKKANKNMDIIGRGGTDFSPIMTYLDEHRDYDGLVIFTDGYAPPPKPPKMNRKTKILWLFNTEANYLHTYAGLKHIGKGAFVKE